MAKRLEIRVLLLTLVGRIDSIVLQFSSTAVFCNDTTWSQCIRWVLSHSQPTRTPICQKPYKSMYSIAIKWDSGCFLCCQLAKLYFSSSASSLGLYYIIEIIAKKEAIATHELYLQRENFCTLGFYSSSLRSSLFVFPRTTLYDNWNQERVSRESQRRQCCNFIFKLLYKI